jgi:hypothetical protein
VADRLLQVVSGVVEADSDAVWDALLETTRSLTSVDGVRVEADPAGWNLAVYGQWWYRGEYTLTDDEHGTFLQYWMYNAAPPLTRWLVPLVAGRALRSSAQPMFERQLTEIGTRLGTRAYLIH